MRFAPDLPGPVRAAIDGFRTGIYEHVVLHWPSSPFRGRDRLASLVGGRLQPPGLLTRVDGTPFHYFELDVPLAARLDAARAGATGRAGWCARPWPSRSGAGPCATSPCRR